MKDDKETLTDLGKVQMALVNIQSYYKDGIGWTYKDDIYSREIRPNVMAIRIRDWLQTEQFKAIPAAGNIIDMLDTIRDGSEMLRAEKSYKAIEYDPTAKDTFTELSQLICGDNYLPIYADMFRQWVYVVKRRIKSLPVKCPFFPILYGGASIGKSKFMRALYAPLPQSQCHLIKEGDKLANSESHGKAYASNLVLHLEEMSGMSKADVEKIKSILDADTLTTRRYHTQEMDQRYIRASLIGATNHRVKNILIALNDIRKWAEITCYTPPEDNASQYCWDRVQAILDFDMLNLWRSVNEEGTEPFSNNTIYDTFRDHVTKTCQSSTPTSEFISDLIDKHKAEQVFITNDELRTQYKNEVPTQYHVRWDMLCELLEKKGFKKYRRNYGRGHTTPPVSDTLDIAEELQY
jgi:hypothetical protein